MEELNDICEITSFPLVAFIVCYNNGSIVHKSLEGLQALASRCNLFDVYILDSGSKSDPIVNLNNSLFPSLCVHFYQSFRNMGYAEGNNFLISSAYRDLGVDFLALIVNPDVIVHADVLISLLHIHSSYPGVFAVSPMTVPSFIHRDVEMARRNAAVNKISFLGTRPKLIDADCGLVQTVFLPGAFVLLNAPQFLRAGMFDTSFFMYLEEIDLFYRMHLLGYPSFLCASQYFVHNEGQAERHSRKTYYITRNSLLLMRKIPLRRWPLFVAGRFLKPFFLLGCLFLEKKTFSNIAAAFHGFWDGCLGKTGINHKYHQ